MYLIPLVILWTIEYAVSAAILSISSRPVSSLSSANSMSSVTSVNVGTSPRGLKGVSFSTNLIWNNCFVNGKYIASPSFGLSAETRLFDFDCIKSSHLRLDTTKVASSDILTPNFVSNVPSPWNPS